MSLSQVQEEHKYNEIIPHSLLAATAYKHIKRT